MTYYSAPTTPLSPDIPSPSPVSISAPLPSHPTVVIERSGSENTWLVQHVCSCEEASQTPIGATASTQESRARSNVINESCQCLMWAAEVFALHVACCIDPPGSDHKALPVSTVSGNTRAKILAFGLVAAIQKKKGGIIMYSKSSSSPTKARFCSNKKICCGVCGTALSFNPPQHLQTDRCLHWKASGRRSSEIMKKL